MERVNMALVARELEVARKADCKDFRRESIAAIAGTSCIGSLVAPLSVLVDVFGMPETEQTDGYKTTQEWGVVFSSGESIRIYDWKGICWRVGGTSEKGMQEIAAVLRRRVISFESSGGGAHDLPAYSVLMTEAQKHEYWDLRGRLQERWERAENGESVSAKRILFDDAMSSALYGRTLSVADALALLAAFQNAKLTRGELLVGRVGIAVDVGEVVQEMAVIVESALSDCDNRERAIDALVVLRALAQGNSVNADDLPNLTGEE